MQAGKAVAARGARVSLAAWAGTLLPAESSTSGASAAVVRLLARANSSCVATGARWFSAGPARWFDPRTHKPTTALEKAFVAATSALGALHDPTRADLVAALGDATGSTALEAMRRRMLADEIGR